MKRRTDEGAELACISPPVLRGAERQSHLARKHPAGNTRWQLLSVNKLSLRSSYGGKQTKLCDSQYFDATQTRYFDTRLSAHVCSHAGNVSTVTRLCLAICVVMPETRVSTVIGAWLARVQ